MTNFDWRNSEERLCPGCADRCPCSYCLIIRKRRDHAAVPELANDVFIPTTTMLELEAVIDIADKAEVAFAEQEYIERDRTIRQGILKKTGEAINERNRANGEAVNIANRVRFRILAELDKYGMTEALQAEIERFNAILAARRPHPDGRVYQRPMWRANEYKVPLIEM